MNMKRGIAMIIPLIIILGLLLLGEYFVVGVYARKEYTLSRFFSEVKYISESDKIETYVRSFQDAVALSLIQSCYDLSFRTNRWQVYVAPNSYQNTIESETDIRNSIANNAITNVKNYLNEYIKFVQLKANSAEELVLAESDSANIVNPSVSWDDTTVTLMFDKIVFRTTDNAYTRSFNPTASINTKMSKIRETYAASFINGQPACSFNVNTATSSISIAQINCNVSGINSAVDNSIASGKLKTAKDCFNTENQANGVEVSGFKRTANPTDITWVAASSCCKFNVELAINMTDISTKYVIYNGAGVSEESLGLRFLIETGNANLCFGAVSCSNDMDCCQMMGGPCATGARCSSGSCICGVGSACPV
jgi:hypothetical protein